MRFAEIILPAKAEKVRSLKPETSGLMMNRSFLTDQSSPQTRWTYGQRWSVPLICYFWMHGTTAHAVWLTAIRDILTELPSGSLSCWVGCKLRWEISFLTHPSLLQSRQFWRRLRAHENKLKIWKVGLWVICLLHEEAVECRPLRSATPEVAEVVRTKQE